MLSLIEVTCPHCGARGQIMMPPLGSIIVGPCPQCEELVVVFCGRVLPLEKEVMTEGSLDEKHQHLMAVLVEFLEDRVEGLLRDVDKKGGFTGAHRFAEDQAEPAAESDQPSQEPAAQPEDHADPSISDSEFDHFKQVDLKLLDNPAYFKSIFD